MKYDLSCLLYLYNRMKVLINTLSKLNISWTMHGILYRLKTIYIYMCCPYPSAVLQITLILSFYLIIVLLFVKGATISDVLSFHRLQMKALRLIG